MFVKFHERLKDSEKGFTLIELLVVILIIAILAAIAIPVFLNQRKKGWISQAESAVKNMATAQESFLTTGNVYTSDTAVLASEGFRYSSADVTPSVHCINGGLRYVVKAVSVRDTTIIRYYDSEVGRPEATTAQPATTCT